MQKRGDFTLITLKQLKSALQAVKSYITSVVPTKTSDLTNDSGYITSAPVVSVNGRTGAVTGLIDAPSSPATGAFLVWDGSAWTAQTLAGPVTEPEPEEPVEE